MADATLGIKIDSSQAKTAVADLDKLNASAKEAQQGVKGLETEASSAGKAIDDLGGSARGFGEIMAAAFARVAGAGAVSALVAGLKSVNDELLQIGQTAKFSGQAVNDINNLANVGRLYGASSADTMGVLKSVGTKLNEAKNEENDLAKLLTANNVQYQDRLGNVISTNKALEIASDLIRRSADEFDKIKIAEMLGISGQWIKVLEQGPEEFRKAQSEARTLGGLVTTEMVERAEQFDAAWTRVWGAFSIRARSAIGSAIEAMQSLASATAKYFEALEKTSNVGPDGLTKSQRASRFNSALRQDMDERFGQNLGLAGSGPQSSFAAARGSERTFTNTTPGLVFDPLEKFPIPMRNPTRFPPPNQNSGGGGVTNDDTISDLDKEIQKIEERTKAIQTATNVIGLSTFEQEKSLAITRLETIAKRDDGIITDEMAASIEKTATAYALAQSAAEQAKQAQRQYTDMLNTGKSAFSGFFTEINSGLQQGKNAWEVMGNAATNALNKITNKIIEMSTNSLFDSIFGKQNTGGAGGGLLGGLFSNLFSGGSNTAGFAGIYANGGVFNSGNVVPFANGGVVSRPTLFPFANGTGLMGEAGPEAIMPLKRDASGRLGVSAGGAMGGGGVVINITNNSKAEVKQNETEVAGQKTIEVMIEDVVVGKMKNRGSNTFGAMQGLGAVRQPLTRR